MTDTVLDVGDTHNQTAKILPYEASLLTVKS